MQFLHVLRNIGSGIAANVAADNLRKSRAGLGSRIKITRGPRPRGMGFLPYESGGEESYDPYYDSYDWSDYFFGYGGDYANPPAFIEDMSVYDAPGINPWTFNQGDYSASDWAWLAGGSNEPYWSDEYGDWTITNPTETGYVDGYQDTLNWWAGLDDGITEDNIDTAFNYSDLQNTLNWWDTITGGHSIGGDLAAASTPPINATKSDKLAWLKKLAEAAKKQLASGARPATVSSGAQPKATQPNAAGQCPAGYAKNAAGQCVQQPKATATDMLGGINPLYLIGGALLLVLLAKK